MTPPLGFKPDTPCVEWSLSRYEKGYGQKVIPGRRRSMGAHRWAWEQAHGPIPPGMCVMHMCDNPPCHRLDHLRLGTKADNNRDAALKGRNVNQKKTHCKNGHPLSGDNLRVVDNGRGKRQRVCAICRQATDRRRRDRERAERRAA